jgi:NAD(P)-dependent dehydrogenase (short-subunit alcohol dehydrogenase family)
MKRILITGANKGIGLATVAKLLDSYDETFLLLGSRDSKKGQEVLNSLVHSQPEWKDRLDVIQIDVKQVVSVNSAAEKVAKKFGRTPSPLYAIVNNAGIGNSMLGLNKILQVNTYGPKGVCDAFLGLLTPSIGRVVNITSASGPIFLADSSEEVKKIPTNPDVSWTEIEEFLAECL